MSVNDIFPLVPASSPTEEPNYLAHYGVKGMRWGYRKSKTTSGSKKKGSKAKQKKPSEMSDDELEARVKRLRKEAEYNRLNNEINKNSGKNIAKRILVASATATTTYYVQKHMRAGVDAFDSMGADILKTVLTKGTQAIRNPTAANLMKSRR